MNLTTFSDRSPGELVPTINGQMAFVPADLPPDIDFNEIARPLVEAMQAIGELRGACRRLQNPHILIRPLQRREALTSSAMEGTFTTADHLVLAEAGIEREESDDTREVRNYMHALNESLRMLDDLPICHRVIQRAHEILLSGLSAARGAQKRPGKYKSEQNWIGGRTIEAARFVPPPPAQTQRCMDAIEAYINRENVDTTSALVDLALVHYQLEAVHPFADGNGRVGRMLISLMAVQSGLLDMPVLYISPALERDKDEYIDLMFNVSAKGEWVPWLTHFFDAVCRASRDAVVVIDRLIALQDFYREKARTAARSGSAAALVDTLFESPAISVGDAQKRLGVSYPTAKAAIDKLVDLNILREVPGIYPKAYIALGIMHVSRADPDEDDDAEPGA